MVMGKKAFGSVVRFGMGSWLAGPTGRGFSAGLPWVCAACTSLTVFTVGIVAPGARAQVPTLSINSPVAPDVTPFTVRNIGPFFTSTTPIAERTTQCSPLNSFEATDVMGENVAVTSVDIFNTVSGAFVTINVMGLDSGPAYITVPAGSFQAADGCANNAALSRTLIGRFDFGNPRPVISLAPDATPSLTEPFDIRIEFFARTGSEQQYTAVTGFALDDFMITNGTVSNLSAVPDGELGNGQFPGSVYRATVTPDATIPAGETISGMIAAGRVNNLVGTPNIASDELSFLAEVVINDANLLSVLLAHGVDTGPVAENSVLLNDLESLTELRANGQEITDITGLEHATSLNTLTLAGNPITNFSPLMNLDTENDHLDLRGNSLNEAAYTTHIPELLTFITNGELLFDPLSASAELIPDPNLRRLVAASVGVNPGLIQTADVARLTELRANAQGIRCLTGLQLATNLQVLTLAGNSLNPPSTGCTNDVTVLSRLTSLRVLNLSNTGITDREGVLLNSVVPDSDDLEVLKLLRNSISTIPASFPTLGSIRRMKLNDNNLESIGQLLNVDGWNDGDFHHCP